MTNSTQEYWDVDGVSLQTYATNITTLGGDREAPANVRGNDIIVPYAPGSIWQEKQADERQITLGMWVAGAMPDGSVPTDRSAKRLYDQNWSALRKLLWRPHTQFLLTKRFWVLESDLVAAGMPLTGLPVSGSGAAAFRLISASTKASYNGGLNPQRQGKAHAIFTVDLKLNDPFFYSAPITIPFTTAAADSTHAGPVAHTTILGDNRTTSMAVTFTGPLVAPMLTNNSADHLLTLQYANSIAAAESAVITVPMFKAQHNTTGLPYKASGYVVHVGDRFWFYLDPGAATITLSVQSGTGTASLAYQPRWH